MALLLQQAMAMLEVARPETRAAARAQPKKFTWGIVDVILAAVMLPFGIWMAVIEAIVHGATRIFNFEARRG